VVTNLVPGVTYYFAIKTSDDIPNLSELSNVAKGSTWNYMFEDCKRNTKLYINTNEKTFQFISPDKDYAVKKATFMCKFFSKIVILHKDDELKLITSSVDKRWDYCVALALDIETCKLYLLIDEYGFET